MTTPQARRKEQQHLPPTFIRNIMNGIVSFWLKSPMHGLISENLMLIRFTGRKSGKQFTTPVTYMQDTDTVTCFTRSAWWKNLREIPQVQILMRGEWYDGIATPITDAQAVASGAHEFGRRYGWESLPRIGVQIETTPPPTEAQLVEVVEGRVMIRIQLETA